MGSKWEGEGNYQGGQDGYIVLWEAEAQTEVPLAAAMRQGSREARATWQYAGAN